MGKTITLDHITKIEGHAKLDIQIEDGEIKKNRITIFEGSRFFEGILKGKHWQDVSPIGSRICGICSVVHSLTALMAVEDAFGLKVTEQTHKLRQVLHFGGQIQSHVLHLYFLALPDYVGFSNAIAMASKYGEEVKRALRIKQVGNKIVQVIGGRDVHPINAIVGGFSRTPTKEQIDELIALLKERREDAIKTVKLFMGLDYPKFTRETNHYCITNDGYEMLKGDITCLDAGGKPCFLAGEYEKHMKEFFNEGHTSEFVVAEGKSYMVGALSRLNVHFSSLSDELVNLVTFDVPSHSPYHNNPAQALEILYCIDKSIEILESLDVKDEAPVEVKPKAGTGVAASEAPRGILFHKYTFDETGHTTAVNITTPTSQNLTNLQLDLDAFLPTILDLPKEDIILEVEKLIRAYDPCISCATHFLEIDWVEDGKKIDIRRK